MEALPTPGPHRRSGEPVAKGAGALFKRKKMNLEQSQPYREGEKCSSKVCLRTNESHFFEGSGYAVSA